MKWAWAELMILAAALVPRVARAQGVNPHATALLNEPAVSIPGASEFHEFMAMVAVIAVTGAVLILIAKTMDYRRKRHDDAIQLEVRISDALLQEPAFVRSSVAPYVRIPFWSGSPARVELRGEATTHQMAEAASRIATKTVSRIRRDFSLENRITVAPASAGRALGASRPHVQVA